MDPEPHDDPPADAPVHGDPSADAPVDGDPPAGAEPTGDANSRRKVAMAVAAVVIAGTVLLAAWSPWVTDRPTADVRAATTSVAPSATSAALRAAGGAVAPLTGLPVAPEDSTRLLRPALVAKIDGSPQAMPQVGLDRADIVMEVRVEGISRYLGVWHSQDVGDIGPVRSARTTDPDLLAAHGRPLFSYSGGNTGVLRELRRSDWFTDVSHDAVPPAYRRSGARTAPGNLMADTVRLWARTPEDLAVPPAQFTYSGESAEAVADGGSERGVAPVAGFAVSVGSDARFVWDDEAEGWRRFAHGRAHEDTRGEPLRFRNVVVLEVDYVRSAADRASPEAVSVGTGPAWVFGPGTVRAGTWNRPDRESDWGLAAESGQPLALEPGNTWLVLADGEPLPLDAGQVERLLGAG